MHDTIAPSPVTNDLIEKRAETCEGGSAAASEPLVGPSTGSFAAQQVHLLYMQANIGLLGTVVLAGILIFVLWSVVPHAQLLAWSSLVSVLTIARFFVVQRYFRSEQREKEVAWWRSAMIMSAGASGIAWGSTAIFLFPETSFVHQIFLTFMLGGLAVGAMGVMATVRTVFLVFFIPTLLPIMFRLFFSGGELSSTMGFLFVFFALFVLAAARHMNESIVQSLQLRSTNVDLIHTLSQAKEEAERMNSQLAASHAALSKSEKRFRSLTEHASDLISILDVKGIMRYHSPSITRLLGYEEQELVGHSVSTLFHSLEEAKLKTAFAALRTEPLRVQAFELRIRHKNGSWRIFESIAQNLLDDPAVRGMVFNSRDITERKEIERLKDDLVSTVSHELRTPLTSLRGFAELMLTREFAPEKQRHFLQVILNEGTRLTNLINDFLDIQRIESGQQTYHFETITLTSLLRDALEVFRADESQHSLRLEAPDNLSPVRADADRLHQVLANLVSNAIKFSPKGGTVIIRARQTADQIVVEVADQGVGIPPDVITQLFQKFYRVDNTETRSIGGTGLGLALVKDIITAHSGQVWVESQLNVGSSFFFSLPIVRHDVTMPEPEVAFREERLRV
ncbi:MAG: ATP-binding protein [Candidatus Binatia bacterium]